MTLPIRALATGLMMMTTMPVTALEKDTTTVNIKGLLVEGPQCIVNGNDKVDVDFGDNLITRRIDGVEYKTVIIYDMTCTGLAQQGLKLTINGIDGFEKGLLGTGKEGLAIRLYKDDSILNVGEATTFTYGKHPTLYAVPVAKDNTKLEAGVFFGLGTMVFAYQ
ncbi:hypothetical protein ACK6WK_22150 [Citrobacter portucalensis]|uniref:hypothetical protein n=1 Tax=Citrobacter portucalensis TaxID=1639133 RepID=UPI003C2B6A9C